VKEEIEDIPRSGCGYTKALIAFSWDGVAQPHIWAPYDQISFNIDL